MCLNDGYPAEKARLQFHEYYDITSDDGLLIPGNSPMGSGTPPASPIHRVTGPA
ncbi:MAG: hypothetical protein JW940_21725 [Polyangiaceae bacterium]|nr:hypothetical protein [Polyangiaceae bacterium]